MRSVSDFPKHSTSDFGRVVEGFLLRPGLPFADVLSAERVERIFKKHGNLFGVGKIYSTVVVLWSFISQALRDGKEASCQTAVARIVVYNQQQGTDIPTSDTGDYCRARNKLSEAALRDLTTEIGAEVEERADTQWPRNGHDRVGCPSCRTIRAQHGDHRKVVGSTRPWRVMVPSRLSWRTRLQLRWTCMFSTPMGSRLTKRSSSRRDTPGSTSLRTRLTGTTGPVSRPHPSGTR